MISGYIYKSLGWAEKMNERLTEANFERKKAHIKPSPYAANRANNNPVPWSVIYEKDGEFALHADQWCEELTGKELVDISAFMPIDDPKEDE